MQAIESKAQPSPPAPTMRQEPTGQATIFEVFARHEIGCELKAVSQWLDSQRGLLSLVPGDLRRHGLRETGRRGLPAETVLRCALLKQQRQLSYEELAFHLEDSASFRAFARLPLAWPAVPDVAFHKKRGLAVEDMAEFMPVGGTERISLHDESLPPGLILTGS